MMENLFSKPIAIENPENICFKCLGEFADEKLHKIVIPSMGWGSGFDNWSTRIHLCENCIKETNAEWWKLEVVSGEFDWSGSWYKYEDDIFNFINTLPLEGQELFWNRYSTDSYQMDGQDWIDYQLDLLPHEKCKDYGLYSPQEEEAYQSQFPICDKVKIVVYGDGSKGSRCPFGAFGNDDGTAKGHQTQGECYECIMFTERKQGIETYSEEDMKIFTLEQKLVLAKFTKNKKTT